MKTVVLGSRPPELEAFIERRRRLGQDSLDEIWEGDYHVVPAPHGRHGRLDVALARLLGPYADAAGLIATSIFNLGDGEDDFRVPDQGYHRSPPDGVWIPTAALVVEIRSPGDETYDKFGFYARHRVEEIAVLDPDLGRLRWFALRDATYLEVERSRVLDAAVRDIASRIDW